MKELEPRSIYWSFLQLERVDKKLRFPSKLFNASSSLFKAGMFPSVGGTELEKLLTCRENRDNSEKFPRKKWNQTC